MTITEQRPLSSRAECSRHTACLLPTSPHEGGTTAFTPILDIRTCRPRRVIGQLQGSRPQLSGSRGQAHLLQGLPSPGITDPAPPCARRWLSRCIRHSLSSSPNRRGGAGPQRLSALSRAPLMRRQSFTWGPGSLNLSPELLLVPRGPHPPPPTGGHIWPAAGSHRLDFIGTQSVTPVPLPTVSRCNSKGEGLGPRPRGCKLQSHVLDRKCLSTCSTHWHLHV